MVGGQLQCIGTPQHLKTRFGRGYQLDMTLRDGKSSTRIGVEEGLMAVFNVKPLEINRSKVRYQLTMKNDALYEAKNDNEFNENNGNRDGRGEMTLANLFKTLEDIKKDRPIVSYAVNQTSLEQIFLTMARDDIEKNKDENEELGRKSIIETMEGMTNDRNNNDTDAPVYQ